MPTILTTLALTLALAVTAQGDEQVYQQPSEFIKSAFSGTIPATSTLILSADLKARVKSILNHDYKESRVRHWSQGNRSVWILEEIGKEKLITTGFIIESGRIKSVEVLIYRESHGWEVSKPFFTGQFSSSSLLENQQLSCEIKNIAGATLSVRALTKLARLALFLDSQL